MYGFKLLKSYYIKGRTWNEIRSKAPIDPIPKAFLICNECGFRDHEYKALDPNLKDGHDCNEEKVKQIMEL